MCESLAMFITLCPADSEIKSGAAFRIFEWGDGGLDEISPNPEGVLVCSLYRFAGSDVMFQYGFQI